MKDIIACLDVFKGLDKREPWLDKLLLKMENGDVEDVDYYHGSRFGSKSCGESTYVISTINSRDKLTRYLYDCTSVVAAGRDKKTGREVSFLSHQDPYIVLHGREHHFQFTDDMSRSLFRLKQRCYRDTIDVVVVGGMYCVDTLICDALETRDMYRKMVAFLTQLVVHVFHFEPTFLVGPKDEPRSDAILYRNDTRRLYVVRPNINGTRAESFLPRDLYEQEKRW